MKSVINTRLLGVALMGCCLVLAGGCRGKKSDAARAHFGEVPLGSVQYGAAGATGATAGQWSGTGAPGEGAYPPGTLVDRDTGGLTELTAEEEFPIGFAVPELSTVYFDYDSDALTESARAALERNVAYLRNNPELSLVLRGHTDDVGTEEYNISLGSRRAQSVREYLAAQGIPAGRINTVSFGKSMPDNESDDEAARAKNRRVEFFVYTE